MSTHKLHIQSEHIRHEGRWWYVECNSHTFCQAIKTYEDETAFLGRGAKQQAEKALRTILANNPDAVDVREET